MRETMTWVQARISARRFIRFVTNPPRPWGIETTKWFAPRGWSLRSGARDSDFYPMTTSAVAAAFRASFVREE